MVEVFKSGTDGKFSYHKPALLSLPNDEMLLFIDGHDESGYDQPNCVSICMKRSEDKGDTWSEMENVALLPGRGKTGPAANNPGVLYDSENGRLFLLYTQMPEGVYDRNCQIGSGFSDQRQWLLHNSMGDTYYLNPDGSVEDNRDYKVDDAGRVYYQDEEVGTVFEDVYSRDHDTKHLLAEYPTAYLMLKTSEDGGRTWSASRCLNPEVKEEWMGFIAGGPGSGLVTSRGRFIFPIWFSNPNGCVSNAVIYSDDQGKTWHRGQSVNDSRQTKHNAATIDEYALGLGQSQVLEGQDGTLYGYCRSYTRQNDVMLATSPDGGENWEHLQLVSALINPDCQFSMTQDKAGNFYYCGPYSSDSYSNGTVLKSEDGLQWIPAASIDSESFTNSSMAFFSDGTLGVAFESSYMNGSDCQFERLIISES